MNETYINFRFEIERSTETFRLDIIAAGDTYPIKDSLKTLGFKWSGNYWKKSYQYKFEEADKLIEVIKEEYRYLSENSNLEIHTNELTKDYSVHMLRKFSKKEEPKQQEEISLKEFVEEHKDHKILLVAKGHGYLELSELKKDVEIILIKSRFSEKRDAYIVTPKEFDYETMYK